MKRSPQKPSTVRASTKSRRRNVGSGRGRRASSQKQSEQKKQAGLQAAGEPAAERQTPVDKPFRIVGMGASAGGLEAMQLFFTHMPPESGLAFVIVQHLDPHHATMMPELLSRVTRMHALQAQDGMRVRPNSVYVIPPNATLTLERGVLRVSPLQERASRAPIDTFFRSLAEDQGEHAICILLSGSGSDGTLGLRAVKEHGGMAMAQEAGTARHDSIPRSAIATGLVDYVLPAEQMPDRLIAYVSHLAGVANERWAEATQREVTDALGRICVLLRHKTGHDFSQYKPNTLVRRVQRRMLVLHESKVAGYLARLREDPQELEALFKDVLIGVTHFFRDPAAFDSLAHTVIPRILDRAGPEGMVRIWTPGCATGEEAYTVAMLLKEEQARRGANAKTRVQIFAGDIDDESLEQARRGLYPDGVAAQVSPSRLERFFTRENGAYLVNKDVREMVVFSTHNLIKDPPFSRLDLIVCRNLLIYLEADLQRRVAQIFHYALKPAGFLFLGPSENLSGPAELFRALDSKHRIFQRNETLTAAPALFPLERPGRREVPLPAHKRAARDSGTVQALERILVEHYSPAWVVVNSHGEVVYYSPRTGRYLEPPSGAPSHDIVGMARKGLRLELRTALHRAMKSGGPVRRDDVTVEQNGDVQRISLVVQPLTELAEQQSGLFMVVFQELGPPLSKAQAKAHGLLPAAPGDPIVKQLESELRSAKEHLQTTVEELETANEELTSANEELLSTNEELQSSNEELQTSKEELQSVNEELETINAELKQKVDQLDAAHNDLQNLYRSTQIATLFLDPQLRIKMFTPAATDLFRLIDSDLGRPITDIALRFPGAELAADVKGVMRDLQPRERELSLGDGSSYLMRILPYKRTGSIDGVILTFLDITHVIQAKAHEAQLAAILQSSPDAIVGRTLEGTITTWNSSATRMFGYSAREAIGEPLSIIVPAERRRETEQVHERARLGELIEPFETERVAKDGRRVPVSVSISAVRDAQGQVVTVSSSFRDLTELSRAKKALQDELRRKDEFLAMLSHELRNPLAPLRACLDILAAPEAGEDAVRRAREMMGRQVGHLTALVNDLLDMSRVASGKIKLARGTVDLAELMRELVEDHLAEVVAQGVVKLKLQRPDKPVWVEGDSTRLSQAIGNVLNNAVKFTEAGSIEVALKTDREADVALLRIKDSGVGMDHDTLDRLFRPFAQAERSLDRSHGGLGLGLALCKGLIDAHGGSIHAFSDGPEQGSEFTIRLPLSKRPSKEAPKPEPQVAEIGGEGARRRVLIVEDSPDAAESLALVLQIAGHTVKTVADGDSALEQARDFLPDVILCDVGLPGMDGYAVAKALRAEPSLRHARLVALTGYGREEDIARSADAGFEVHASKPIDAETLRRLLAELPQSK